MLINEMVKLEGLNVTNTEDLSDEYMKRVRVTFANGCQLSIIQGEHSYGGKQGLYEIAPYNKEGEMDGSMFDKDDQGDDVLGWCTPEMIRHYMFKINNYKE